MKTTAQSTPQDLILSASSRRPSLGFAIAVKSTVSTPNATLAIKVQAGLMTMTISPDDDLLIAFTTHLCSQLCHDLASPIGAISTALELAASPHDNTDTAFALAQSSAREAAARLIFMRMCYGRGLIAGVSEAKIEQAVAGVLDTEKYRLSWLSSCAEADTSLLQLTLNMLIYTREAIPGGGSVTISINPAANSIIELECHGRRARIPPQWKNIAAEFDPDQPHFWFLSLLAQRLALKPTAQNRGDGVVLQATRS